MNKFFRKYNKWLLAVFGSGLMLIFLMPEIPSLLSNMGSGQAVVGSIDGKSITRSELGPGGSAPSTGHGRPAPLGLPLMP